jgi:hypothetical protein
MGITASILLCDSAAEGGLGTANCPELEGYYLAGNSSAIIDTASFSPDESVVVVLFNPLGVTREEMVSIRCSSLVTVVDSAGDELVTSSESFTDEQGDYYNVSFVADLPALGLGSFYVKPRQTEAREDCFTQEAAGTEDHMSIGNDWIQVNIDAATGGIASITSWIGPFQGEEIPINQARP